MLYIYEQYCKALPIKTLTLDPKFKAAPYNATCRSESCWNVLKCSSLGNFRVHMDLISRIEVIEDDLTFHGYPSIEFYQLYKWIKNSPYYTDKVEESCIRLPGKDIYIGCVKNIREYSSLYIFLQKYKISFEIRTKKI